jgi:DNA modification methylase
MPKHQLKTSVIYCGDNLEMLKEIPDESIDLIYIDPPFNSNRNYETFWGDTQEKRAFEDRFGAAEAYISYMRPRVVEMHRVLKSTGSFYYHCDWHASHYVKVMLDQVFGFNDFENEIIWRYRRWPAKQKAFQRMHDTIFFYTKQNDNSHTFNQLYEALATSTLKVFGGSKQVADFSSGHRKPGVLGEQSPGALMSDVWEISIIAPSSKERLGYPTQKPLPLLERIIEASSNKGDVVLDAFCGCGTALVAAQKLGRKWIGIDISPTACRVMAQRLWDTLKLDEEKDFKLINMLRNEHQLREMPPFEFENWAVVALGGIPNRVKVGDYGIDGKLYPVDRAKGKDETSLLADIDTYYPIQVKQKDKAGRPDIDAFETAMRRDRRKRGYFISFDFTEDAMREIRRLDREGELEIIPITVKELLDKSGFEIARAI